MGKRRIWKKKKQTAPKDIPPSQLTEPQTFILESLNFDDEENKRSDGKILYDALKLQGKDPKYYYFRTETELIHLVQTFRKTGYRYLHLSCHGNDDSVAFTIGNASFAKFAEIFETNLHHRRIFVSGCSLGKKNFADALFGKNSGMYSLTAPIKDVFFDQAATFWSAFYYLMHAYDSQSMKKAQLTDSLDKLGNMFEMPMAHFYKHTQTNTVKQETYGTQEAENGEKVKKIFEEGE